MFKIKWHYHTRANFPVMVEGIGRYADRAAAEKQAAIWRRVFPDNKYFVLPA